MLQQVKQKYELGTQHYAIILSYTLICTDILGNIRGTFLTKNLIQNKYFIRQH